MSTTVEVDDVQSLVFSGHARLPASRAVGLTVQDALAARLALRELVETDLAFGFGAKDRTHAVQLLLTAPGVAALGGSAAEWAGFSRPFHQGMATPPRSRALGDSGTSDPAGWTWSDDRLHALLLIYAADDPRVQAEYERIRARLTAAWSEVFHVPIDLPADGREPFGFRDGLSGTRVDVGDGRAPEPGVALLPPGEVVLGYPNAGEIVPPVPAFGQNGSFVVIRQLEQDVGGFWAYWRSQGKSEQEAVWLASKALGRWPNGMPIDGSAALPEPKYDEAQALAPFQFSADARGLKCPFGAHVRRANPRDGLGDDPETSLAAVAHHRMIRRGRTYGPSAPAAWYPPAIREAKLGGEPGSASDSRGLWFICLCADIARQFEFVQQTWLNNPKFSDLYDEVDPIAAGRDLPADSHRFSIPRAPLRCRLNGLARWVRVRGGGYFLLPGKRALLRLLT